MPDHEPGDGHAGALLEKGGSWMRLHQRKFDGEDHVVNLDDRGSL